MATPVKPERIEAIIASLAPVLGKLVGVLASLFGAGAKVTFALPEVLALALELAPEPDAEAPELAEAEAPFPTTATAEPPEVLDVELELTLLPLLDEAEALAELFSLAAADPLPQGCVALTTATELPPLVELVELVEPPLLGVLTEPAELVFPEADVPELDALFSLAAAEPPFPPTTTTDEPPEVLEVELVEAATDVLIPKPNTIVIAEAINLFLFIKFLSL